MPRSIESRVQERMKRVERFRGASQPLKRALLQAAQRKQPKAELAQWAKGFDQELLGSFQSIDPEALPERKQAQPAFEKSPPSSPST
jgi:hypothetical protein